MSDTALQIITDALKDIRVVGVGRTPTDAMAQDALSALNNMLDSWGLERLAVYHVKVNTGLTWTALARSMTIGSGGGFNIALPSRIVGAIFTVLGYDYTVRKIISVEEYERIAAKDSTSTWPEFIAFDRAYPLGTVYGYPKPNAALTTSLLTWEQLQQFSSLTDQISLPQGYRRAIQKSLAIELAPMYGPSAAPSKEVLMQAKQAKSAIKGMNVPSMVAHVDGALIGKGYARNVYADLP